MNRILVLGANGALGRHIVQRAISSGLAVSAHVRREANERAFNARIVGSLEKIGDVGMIRTIDRVPFDLPRQMAKLSDFEALRALAPLVSRSVVTYQAAANVVISNCAPGGEMSRHRAGLALAVEGAAR